eukprot:766328-Hanusia_phi.AAC.2
MRADAVGRGREVLSGERSRGRRLRHLSTELRRSAACGEPAAESGSLGEEEASGKKGEDLSTERKEDEGDAQDEELAETKRMKNELQLAAADSCSAAADQGDAGPDLHLSFPFLLPSSLGLNCIFSSFERRTKPRPRDARSQLRSARSRGAPAQCLTVTAGARASAHGIAHVRPRHGAAPGQDASGAPAVSSPWLSRPAARQPRQAAASLLALPPTTGGPKPSPVNPGLRLRIYYEGSLTTFELKTPRNGRRVRGGEGEGEPRQRGEGEGELTKTERRGISSNEGVCIRRDKTGLTQRTALQDRTNKSDTSSESCCVFQQDNTPSKTHVDDILDAARRLEELSLGSNDAEEQQGTNKRSEEINYQVVDKPDDISASTENFEEAAESDEGRQSEVRAIRFDSAERSDRTETTTQASRT